MIFKNSIRRGVPRVSRGGTRPGAGRPLGSRNTKSLLKDSVLDMIVNETPLEYGLRIMRDPNVDPLRRDRMCQCLLPYLHTNKSRDSKKMESEKRVKEILESD